MWSFARTRITGTPFSRLCAWRVVSRRAAQEPFLVAPGYFRHWAGDGGDERSRRQIQDETEETGGTGGHAKICIT